MFQVYFLFATSSPLIFFYLFEKIDSYFNFKVTKHTAHLFSDVLGVASNFRFLRWEMRRLQSRVHEHRQLDVVTLGRPSGDATDGVRQHSRAAFDDLTATTKHPIIC